MHCWAGTRHGPCAFRISSVQILTTRSRKPSSRIRPRFQATRLRFAGCRQPFHVATAVDNSSSSENELQSQEDTDASNSSTTSDSAQTRSAADSRGAAQGGPTDAFRASAIALANEGGWDPDSDDEDEEGEEEADEEDDDTGGFVEGSTSKLLQC